MENKIELPYNIGDTVYILENFNEYDDIKNGYKPIHTIYKTDIVIKPIIVEGFIIDEEGIFLAEDGWDGWNKIVTYHSLTLEEYEDCKIFGTEKEANEFVNKIKVEV